MGARRGLTLAELVVTLIVVAVVAVGVVWLLWRLEATREEARRIRCRNNLNSLAKGMAVYLNEHGGDRWFPFPLGLGASTDDFNGAEWLAALYWSGVLPDPQVYLCPSTTDRNAGGRDIGAARAGPAFGSQTVSYAAMHYRCGAETDAPAGSGHRDWSHDRPDEWSGWRDFRVATDRSGRPTPGAIRDDYPPNLPMASDDTQGTINHGRRGRRGVVVLFFDSHVEFWEEPAIDPANAVGRKPGPLWLLSN